MKRYVPKYLISRTDRGEVSKSEARKLIKVVQPSPSNWWWVISILIGIFIGLSFLVK